MTEPSPAKSCFLVFLWAFGGLMWLVFGFLYWFRVHQHFFGAAFFVLSAYAFWFSLRLQKRRRG